MECLRLCCAILHVAKTVSLCVAWEGQQTLSQQVVDSPQHLQCHFLHIVCCLPVLIVLHAPASAQTSKFLYLAGVRTFGACCYLPHLLRKIYWHRDYLLVIFAEGCKSTSFCRALLGGNARGLPHTRLRGIAYLRWTTTNSQSILLVFHLAYGSTCQHFPRLLVCQGLRIFLECRFKIGPELHNTTTKLLCKF